MSVHRYTSWLRRKHNCQEAYNLNDIKSDIPPFLAFYSIKAAFEISSLVSNPVISFSRRKKELELLYSNTRFVHFFSLNCFFRVSKKVLLLFRISIVSLNLINRRNIDWWTHTYFNIIQNIILKWILKKDLSALKTSLR